MNQPEGAVGICYFEPFASGAMGGASFVDGIARPLAAYVCQNTRLTDLPKAFLINSTAAHSDPQASQAKAVVGFLVADEGSDLKHKGTAMRKIEEQQKT